MASIEMNIKENSSIQFDFLNILKKTDSSGWYSTLSQEINLLFKYIVITNFIISIPVRISLKCKKKKLKWIKSIVLLLMVVYIFFYHPYDIYKTTFLSVRHTGQIYKKYIKSCYM